MKFNKENKIFFMGMGVIALIVIISTILTINQAEPEQKSTLVQTTLPAPIPTITPTGELLVQYSVKTKERFAIFDEYKYPKSGMIFLVFDLKITNNGWKSITSNNFYWDLSASTKDNPATFVRMDQVFSSGSEGIICESAEIGVGGTSSCKLAYEVPANYDRYNFKYNMPLNFNVRYEKIEK